MKIKLIVFALMIASTTFAQTKKPVKSQATQTTKAAIVDLPTVEPAKVDTIQLVKEKAQKWFKDVIVKLDFKDPYSYEPLNTEVEPVSLYTKLQEDTADLAIKIRIQENILSDLDSTDGLFKKYKRNVEDYEKKALKSNGKVNPYLKSKYEEQLEYLTEKRTKAAAAKLKYDSAQSKLAAITERLKTMSDVEKQSVGYYRIYHDCHANNSYGGKVLGKYTFKYTLDNVGDGVHKIN